MARSKQTARTSIPLRRALRPLGYRSASDQVATAIFTPQPNSRLLSLPPELRDRIYEFVFQIKPARHYGCGSHTDGVIVLSRRALTEEARSVPSVLSILQTCKQTCDEAQMIFYHAYHFRISFADLAGGTSSGGVQQDTSNFGFVDVLSAPRLNAIQAVTITLDDGMETPSAVEALSQHLENLRILELHIEGSKYYDERTSPRTSLEEYYSTFIPRIEQAVGRMKHLEYFTISMPDSFEAPSLSGFSTEIVGRGGGEQMDLGEVKEAGDRVRRELFRVIDFDKGLYR